MWVMMVFTRWHSDPLSYSVISLELISLHSKQMGCFDHLLVTWVALLYTFLITRNPWYNWPLFWLPGFNPVCIHDPPWEGGGGPGGGGICSKHQMNTLLHMEHSRCFCIVAMTWRVSPAFPGIMSVIGFSGSGLVFLYSCQCMVSNTNTYIYICTTQATKRWSKQPMSFYCAWQVLISFIISVTIVLSNV